MLTIYNTLSRKKEIFKPIIQDHISLYVCGMTVYDYCHMGHARVLVVFDMISRWFKASGYKVTYVRNITDIDDKIIQRSVSANEPINSLVNRFIDAMHEDSQLLMVQKPEKEPRATYFISAMVEMIRALEEKGIAYSDNAGNVYYSVAKFHSYGKLSGKSIDDLRAGERVEINTAKKDPLDFVLWKTAKPHEPSWDSPWGKGRPGWHIECSAMSRCLLGDRFDIHGGGQDLQFPHHENEIAQSEGVLGHQHVNYWIHNGFVQINNEKMSKSLGNFFTIREILKKYDPETVRFFILSAQYRSPLNYCDENLETANKGLGRLYVALNGFGAEHTLIINWDDHYALRFKQAMDDDFNTPKALAVLFDLATEINKTKLQKHMILLKLLGGTLGLLHRDAVDYFQKIDCGNSSSITVEQIEAVILQRNKARKEKNYAEADRIRKMLLQDDIILEDTLGNTSWRRN